MDPVRVQEKDYSAEKRKELAKKGHALPDGSFPIEDAGDVTDAVKLWGHAKDPAAAKRHIIKRARALGATDRLPAGWQVKEAESQDGCFAHLAESTELDVNTGIGDDGSHLIEATLIRSGTSRMGNVYPAQVLEAAVPLFEGARAFVDHNRNDQLPERSVRDLVGYYKSVRMDGDRLRGQLHLVPGHDWLFSLLKEAQGNPNLCGLSIDAWADQDPYSKQVRAILGVNSVDVVTKPSAGGQLDRVLHSDTGAPTSMDSNAQTQDPPANQAPANQPPANAPQGQPANPPAHVSEGGNPAPGSPTGATPPTAPAPHRSRLSRPLKRQTSPSSWNPSRVSAIVSPASSSGSPGSWPRRPRRTDGRTMSPARWSPCLAWSRR